MTTVTRKPGESDAAFRARAFAYNRTRCAISQKCTWQATPSTRDELRADSPSGLVPVQVSLRMHAYAILAVVATVSVGVWFLS